MLNLLAKSKIVQSQEFPVMAGSSITAEGLALMQQISGGVEYVLPTAGGAEVFMGFSYGEVFTPATKSLVESLVIPAAGAVTLTLLHAPLTNTQVSAYDVTNTVIQVLGNPAVANQYSCVGTLLTFHAAKAGATMRVTYRYSPTAEELIAVDNVRITSFSSTDYVSSIGCIQEGEIYTDQFNAARDWGAATGVKTMANGLLDTQTGGGTVIACVITHVPDVSYPFLGIRF